MATLETPRLFLRPFAIDDAADHARLYSDPEVTRHLSIGPLSPEIGRAHV